MNGMEQSPKGGEPMNEFDKAAEKLRKFVAERTARKAEEVRKKAESRAAILRPKPAVDVKKAAAGDLDDDGDELVLNDKGEPVLKKYLNI